MKHLKQRLLITLSYFILLNVMRAQDSTIIHRLTIADCVAYAQHNNVQVKNAMLDLQTQIQTNRSYTAMAMPRLDGSVGGTDYLEAPQTAVPAVLFGGPIGTFAAVSFTPKYSMNWAFTASQVIFDGQVFIGLSARKTALDYQYANIEITTKTITANIYKTYFQLIVSKTQVGLMDANIARAEQLLKESKNLFENGLLDKLSVDRTSVQLSNLQTQRIKTIFAVKNGFLGLKYLLGMPLTDSLVLMDDLTEEDIKNVGPEDIFRANRINKSTGDTAREFAPTTYEYTNRPEYKSLLLSRKLNEYDIKRYRAALMPRLNLTGTYQKSAFGSDLGVATKTWYPAFFVGLNLNVPIFAGFSRRADIQKAKVAAARTDNLISDMKASTETSATQAITNFRTAVMTIDYQRKNMELAEDAYRQTQEKYTSGLASNTDVISAQTDLTAAQSSYISALYDAIIAKVDYQRVTGKL